jgi:hypothetical protein
VPGAGRPVDQQGIREEVVANSMRTLWLKCNVWSVFADDKLMMGKWMVFGQMCTNLYSAVIRLADWEQIFN